MHNVLSNLKEKYNALLAREKAAETYINNSTDREFNKWLPKFNEITKELSKLMQEYKTLTGIEMTNDEVLNGF